uniref:Membrane protein n=2 Tax=Human coronavirus HKU1 TaxID=290028 RepID=VME1_CVHN5|nr:RecName: Full=Membrane protein; Short=M protein; AltName: Full=E1 glycoprotein; AltName: Full=Matrix glycoprotein; AltName: Full=Membrane glycoprotein [Human coronavirus HKU1 (isolate N5)]ABC70722.1 membrane glycoprotein [Human coronavirus HKU1]ABD75508.1 membrane glycoprotein [Human coronavirus HKU1]ABD75516.1 membrane glycoprotein [Human coronavirus HKU1]ABD75524.1 membrane glycoprotein [Human coronavirus HKU1]ABD75628.1 membrane glycoprotein [Human coronavirus HKU1]
MNESIFPHWNSDQAITFLKEWNFSLGVILLLITIILQFGYTSRSMFVYLIKMIILWLMWPLTIILTIFNCFYALNNVFLGLSILFTIISIVIWILYFVNSIRLFIRTGSWWSFNPETNNLMCIDMKGKMYVRPVIEDYHTLTATVIRGHLYIQGVKLGTGYTLADLPVYVTVAKVQVLCTYKRAFLDKLDVNSGFAVFVKSKVGNYRLPSSKSSGMDTALLRA